MTFRPQKKLAALKYPALICLGVDRVSAGPDIWLDSARPDIRTNVWPDFRP